MANFFSGSITLLFDTVKIGEATGGEYNIMNGVQRVETNDATGFTSGRTVTDISWKSITPKAGYKAAITDAILTKKEVKIQFNLEGKFHTVAGRMASGKFSWDDASGKCEGDFAFLGGEPIVVG